jgi:hypothetical protein
VNAIVSKKIRWLAALGVAGALIVAAAVLVFTPSGPANSAAFSTATLSLTLNSQTGQLVFTDLNLDNMTPGAEEYAPLQVGNAGSTRFTYRMSAIESGDSMLADALTIGIAAVSSGTCTSGSYQAGASVYTDAPGLSKAAIVGRVLRPGTSEYLCFHVQLPPGAPNDLHSQSAAVTLNFTAQQS